MSAPDCTQTPAIKRLVEHYNGPVELSRRLGGMPSYQQISQWLARGWASPMHLHRLEPLLPRSISRHALVADREQAKAREEAERKRVKRRSAKPEGRRSGAGALQ